MSTKINARSPIYLNYAEPTVSQPTLNCATALGKEYCMEISERGIITLDTPAYGFIESYTSSDAGFSNGKYSDVTSPTTRTVSLTIAIPQGFTNSSDNYKVCDVDAVQPAFVSGTTCTSRIAPNGSMTNVSIAKDGASSTSQSTASKFTLNGDTITDFTFSQDNESLFSVSTIVDSGTDLNIIITSNTICGTGYLRVTPVVSNSTSCQTFQQITVDVTGCGAFACTDAPLSGGTIDPDGTISVKPTSAAFITTSNNISTDASGSPIVTSVAANSSGSPIDRILYYKLTIPPNFTSAGGDKWCVHTISQLSSGTLPAFTYATAQHAGFGIDQDGNIIVGDVVYGTIKSYVPVGVSGMQFPAVDADTTRQVDIVITSPNESATYSNPNTDITERVSMAQPARFSICSSSTNIIYLSQPFSTSISAAGARIILGLCGQNYNISTEARSSVTYSQIAALQGAGARVCTASSNPFDGKYKAYLVATSGNIGIVGQSGQGTFPVIIIDRDGRISEVTTYYCLGSNAYGGIIQ